MLLEMFAALIRKILASTLRHTSIRSCPVKGCAFSREGLASKVLLLFGLLSITYQKMVY